MWYNNFAVLKTAGFVQTGFGRYNAIFAPAEEWVDVHEFYLSFCLWRKEFFVPDSIFYLCKGVNQMPSESVLAQKQKFVDDLAEKLKSAAGGVLVDYKGISVEDDTKLRKDLRENGVDYFVVKNTLLKRAAEKAGIDGLEPALSGTTAIAISNEDIIIAPKLLYKKAESSDGKFSIKLGFVDGKAISKEEVEAYAKLPSKETLLSQLVFMLQSPMQRLAIAINEIAKKNDEQSA